MSKCWEKEPKKRPTFSQIVEIIRSNMESAVSSYYLHLDAPYQKFNQEKEFAPKTERFGLSKMLNKNSKQIAFPHRVEGYDVGLQYSKPPERFSSTSCKTDDGGAYQHVKSFGTSISKIK